MVAHFINSIVIKVNVGIIVCSQMGLDRMMQKQTGMLKKYQYTIRSFEIQQSVSDPGRYDKLVDKIIKNFID